MPGDSRTNRSRGNSPGHASRWSGVPSTHPG
jgi:hypothetical protein